MKRKKSVAAIILTFAMFLAMGLSACSKDNAPVASTNPEPTVAPTEPPAEPVELIWAMQGAANEIEGWQTVVDVANEKLKDQNISITIQKVNTSDWDEYYQKIVAQIAAGSSPDIGRIAESLMPQVISKNQVLDITPYFSDIDTSQYFESTFENAGKVGNQMYGLPSGVYDKPLYYNKDLFDAKGIPYPSADWNNPMTMDELADIAQQLSEGEGANRVYGYFSEVDIFQAGNYAGQHILSTDLTFNFTDKHQKVYETFDRMLNVDHSMPTPVETAIMGGMDMFRAGKVAMICDGTWWHQTVRDITDFNVGIAAVPSVEGEGHAVSFIDNYVIWSGTEHPDESWEALKAIFSEDCISALAETGNGGIPVNRNTLKNKQDALIGDVFDDVSKQAFMDALDHAMTMPYNTSFSEVSAQTASIMEPWMVGNKDLSSMLDELKTYLSGVAEK